MPHSHALFFESEPPTWCSCCSRNCWRSRAHPDARRTRVSGHEPHSQLPPFASPSCANSTSPRSSHCHLLRLQRPLHAVPTRPLMPPRFGRWPTHRSSLCSHVSLRELRLRLNRTHKRPPLAARPLRARVRSRTPAAARRSSRGRTFSSASRASRCARRLRSRSASCAARGAPATRTISSSCARCSPECSLRSAPSRPPPSSTSCIPPPPRLERRSSGAHQHLRLRVR